MSAPPGIIIPLPASFSSSPLHGRGEMCQEQWSERRPTDKVSSETHLLVPGRYAWQTLSEHLTIFWRLIFVFRTLPFQNACQNTRCPRTLLRTLYSVKPFVKCSAKLTNAWHFSCSNILSWAILALENAVWYANTVIYFTLCPPYSLFRRTIAMGSACWDSQWGND